MSRHRGASQQALPTLMSRPRFYAATSAEICPATKSLKLFVRFIVAILGIPIFFNSTFSQPAQQRAELVIQTGHTGPVASVTFSPDGRTVASEGEGTIKLWDANSGHELRTIERQQALKFDPEGNTFTTVAGQTITRWDTASGKILRTVTMGFAVAFPFAFSTDGKTVASVGLDIDSVSKKSQYMIKLGDTETGEILRSIPFSDGFVVAFSFSPDGKTLACKSLNRTITLWEITTGQLLHKFDAFPASPSSLIFSPDGKILASTDERNTIRLWNLQTGQVVRTLAGHTFGNYSLAFSPDGTVLACGGASKTSLVKLWEVKTGRELQTFAGRAQATYALAFSPDGKSLAGGGNKTIDLWDALSGRHLRALEGHAASVYWLAVSRNGKVFAKGDGRVVRTWSLPTWREFPTLNELPNYVTPLALSADGRTLVSNGHMGQIKLWDVQRGEELRSLDGHTESVTVVAFSRDEKLIASGSSDKTIRIWDPQTGRELRTLEGHTDRITAIEFSPDGKLLASASYDDTIKLWSVDTGNQLWTIPNLHSVEDLTFSPNGQIIASSGSRGQLWEVNTGRNLHDLLGSRGSLTFSPDGNVIAGEDMGEVIVWNTTTGEEENFYKSSDPHTFAAVTAIVPDFYHQHHQITADGKWEFGFGGNGRTDLFDFQTKVLRASFFTFDDHDWLAVTPDGFFDGTPGAWKKVIWRLDNHTFRYAPIEAFFGDFFRPGLLEDIFRGQPLGDTVDISRKDIRPPIVKMSVAGRLRADNLTQRRVTIRVRIVDAKPDRQYSNRTSGARDVRLFRNGSLVRVWHGDVLKGRASVTLETTVSIIAGENELTAYAFNHDNVKSSDADLVVMGADSLKRQGTAYILAIGVNEYSNAQYNLRYAVADADDFSAEVKRQQELLRRYAKVEVTSLANVDATKANITRKLAELARQVQPEDAVMVYFAGHGTAQGNQFYLIPHDLGYSGARDNLDEAGLKTILDHSMSDSDLEKLFEGIDAGQLLLVIDACNSGQALEAEEKRRGPMNSKGLAQLAYEKGMYVMTAAQSYQAAQEAQKLGHGFLTYALVESGLKKRAADREPKNGMIDIREWLNFATEEVPRMQEENSQRALSGKGRYVVFVGDGTRTRDATPNAPVVDNIQRPRIFYRRELEANPLIVAGPPPPR